MVTETQYVSRNPMYWILKRSFLMLNDYYIDSCFHLESFRVTVVETTIEL